MRFYKAGKTGLVENKYERLLEMRPPIVPQDIYERVITLASDYMYDTKCYGIKADLEQFLESNRFYFDSIKYFWGKWIANIFYKVLSAYY